jgi:WD40 repeat protein
MAAMRRRMGDRDDEPRRRRRDWGRERERSSGGAGIGLLIGGIVAGVIVLVALACGGFLLVLGLAARTQPVAEEPPAPVAWGDPAPAPVAAAPAAPAPQPGDVPRAPGDAGADLGIVPEIPPLPPPEARPVLVLDPGGHTGVVRKVFFTPDARQIVTVSLDKTVRVWDAQTGEPLRTLRLPVGPGSEGALAAAALSPDGKRLAVGGTPFGGGRLGFLVHVLALDDGRVEAVLKGHRSIITGLAFSPDGLLLASGSFDNTARIYDARTWEPRAELKGHKGAIDGLAFSKTGRLATGSRDHTVRLWDLKAPDAPQVLTGHTADVACVTWSPDGLTLATGSVDGTVRLWDGAGRPVSSHPHKKGKEVTQVWSLSFTPDGKRLLYAGVDLTGAAGMLEPATNTRLEFSGHNNSVQHASLSPDGKLAATTGGDGHETFIWKTDDAAVVHTLRGAGRSVWGIGWGADGKSIAWGNTNRGGTQVGRTPLEQVFHLDSLEIGEPGDAKFRRCALSSEGYTLVPRDLYSYELKHQNDPPVVIVTPHKGERIYNATLLPGGRAVLGGSDSLYLVELPAGKVVRKFKGHSGIVLGVAPSPDNKFFVTGSTDETMRVWSPERDEPLLSIFVADGEWIAWTPEGYYAASPAGERLMGWQINNSPDKLATYYPAVQFRASLYQPDVIRLLLPAGGLAGAIAQASRERKQRIEALVLTQVLPPQVAITSPAPAAGGVRSNGAPVEVRATANSTGNYPVTALRLLLDGRPFQGQKGLRTVAKPQLGLASASWTVTVPAGRHVLTVQAESAVSKGLSAPLEVVAPEGGQPSLYMVAVGVSAYPGRLRLNFAASDAVLMAKTFRENAGGLFKKVDVHLVTDRDATRARVLSELEWLGSVMTPDDVGVVFFSGHGTRDEQGNFYLVPVDVRLRDVRNSCVPGDLLKQRLADMPGRLVAMLDACHSGAAADDFRASRPDNLVRDLVTDDYGVVVMCSSQGREESMESTLTRAGFFTLGMTEGLTGRADLNHDGVVYIHELDAYAAGRVRQMSGGKQHPVTGRPPTIRSFPLARH